ncbi:MAG TPA: response regulator transcription factor [Reyranella sp.]|nr:response regulator transcription factor [Reyranella sp.]
MLIADDHAYTRAGIRLALEDEGFQVCAEAATGRRALEEALGTQPDIALLDVHMPDGTGVWAAEEITSKLPQTTVVMLTYSRDDEDLVTSLRAGASGYLLKDMDPDRLGVSLRNVLAGEMVLPRSLMTTVVDHVAAEPRPRAVAQQALTAREAEVADLLCAGYTTEEIADELEMSAVTARVHISNIVKKLQVADRDEAVALLNGHR